MRKLMEVNSRRIIFGEVAMCLLLFFIYFIRQAGGIIETIALPKEEKKIAITFDDGPHSQYTEQLLDGLKKRGVHATFFVTGEHAEQYPDIIKRMSTEGHIIGNHTYSHIQLTSGNREKFKQELIKTNKIITDITGKEVLYVRPPYGTWDKSFETELNMFPVLWNVDPLDWCSNNASCVVNRVLKNAEESSESKAQEEESGFSISNMLSNFADKVSDAAQSAGQIATDKIEEFQDALNQMIEGVAVMIVTTCVVPILVLMAFMGVLKFVTGLNLPTPTVQSMPRASILIKKRKKNDIQTIEK